MGRSRRTSVAVAVVAAAGAVTLGLVAASRPTGPRANPTELASALEGRLRERAAALLARVTTLSELPRLAAAVATDADTVRDLSSEELAFRPRPGEVITISQSFRDGRHAALLTLPEGGDGETGTQPGLKTRVKAGGIVLAQTAEIVPLARADELVGILTVTWPVAAKDLMAGILDPTTAARLELGASAVSINSARDPKLDLDLSIPVSLPGDVGAAATLKLRGGSATGRTHLWWLGAGLSALVSMLSWLRLRGRTGAGTSDPSVVPVQSNSIDPVAASAGLPTPSTRETEDFLPAFKADPSAVTRTSGPRIGRYAIVRPLGLGGMAEVFLARAEGEAGFGKLVAFKVLQPLFATQPEAVELFLDEARLAAGLDHPNIVQTHDLGKAGDRYFIAMEYVDGTDLARLIGFARERGARVPTPIALAILCRICDGLHAAHTAVGPDGQPLWLVHRDVKSANVFVSRTGAVKIGDFGIAKATHEVRMSRTDFGQVKGTPGYMAPEHRLGEEVDRRTDLYGVGAIAYELFSGSPVNLDLLTLAARGTEGWPHLPPLAATRADIPPALDQVIFKALSYKRDDRFTDCAAFEQALRTVGAATGIAEDKEIGAWTRAELGRVTADADPIKGAG